MRHIRIIHKLRTAAALLAFAALVTGAAMLWWANHTGLPDSWRGQIEKALASQGVFVEIGSLRYHPLRGVEASDVAVFPDASHEKAIARVDRLLIGLDRSKLAHGDVRVEKLKLSGGALTLPVDPGDPHSKILQVENASGQLLMSGGRRVEIRDVRGVAEGIRVQFDALLLANRQRLSQMPKESDEARNARRKMMLGVLDALEPWRFPASEPPLIRIRVEGDLDDPRSVRASFSAQAQNFSHGPIHFARFAAKGELRGSLLVADSVELSDASGSVKARVEYDLKERTGRFEAKSGLDLPALLLQLQLVPVLDRITFESPPVISAAGEFSLPENAPPTCNLIGHISTAGLAMGEYSATRVDAGFSWDGRRFFLDQVEAVRPDGYLKASVLSDPPIVRYRIETDLRANHWKGLFKGLPLEGVLNDFKDLPGAYSHARLKGSLDTTSATNWTASGEAEGRNLSFRGVPIHSASVKMALDHNVLDFTDGKVDFDYTDYPLHRIHGGPVSGKGVASRIRYNHDTNSITVENVDGDFWPAPLVRTFAANIADHLEEYGYHTPPHLHGSGLIGLGPGQKISDLRINAVTDGDMDYHFAGANLTLSHVKTNVKVGPQITEVRDLSFDACAGALRGQLDIDPDPKRGGVKGSFDWTRVSLPALSTTYGFEHSIKGVVTGRIDFEEHGSTVAGLSGEGLATLEDGELFSVPVFGPLSPIVSAVTGKKAGFQEAESAFCTFDIQQGVLHSPDFLTTTRSVVFTGDATANLNDLTLDMTMRMNARGLLGLVTLPLKPFVGVFQFHGSGPLRNPKWDSEMFTKPPKRQEKALLAPPPKAGLVDPSEDPEAPAEPPVKKSRGLFH